MADSAFQVQYRQEFVAGFEQRQSLLRDTVTTEAVIKGGSAVFLVADSGGATTVTRGLNGLIPGRPDNLTQNTCTLTEEHDKAIKTGFNVFASQGNQRMIMQQTSMGVVNRKIDDQVITQLNTGTVTAGATALPFSVNIFAKSQTILGNAEVPWDGNITALLTPAAFGYLQQATEFSNAQYVNMRTNADGSPMWKDMPQAYRWRNALILVHPNLPGVGTNAEKCFLYHKSAIGHAMDVAGMQTFVGYDEEDDYSYARTSAYMGAKLLQNSGVVVINHDGSALSA